MRKFGAFGLAAFYLLLTTGMFVCIVHCATAYLFTQPVHAMADNHTGTNDHDCVPHEKDHKHKKSCGDNKDCSCCNKHDNYVIKENVNNGLSHQLITLQISVHTIPYQLLSLQPGVYCQNFSWPNPTGPPLFSSLPLYISYRSLLI
jgi:hypothetical protein